MPIYLPVHSGGYFREYLYDTKITFGIRYAFESFQMHNLGLIDYLNTIPSGSLD